MIDFGVARPAGWFSAGQLKLCAVSGRHRFDIFCDCKFENPNVRLVIRYVNLSPIRRDSGRALSGPARLRSQTSLSCGIPASPAGIDAALPARRRALSGFRGRSSQSEPGAAAGRPVGLTALSSQSPPAADIMAASYTHLSSTTRSLGFVGEKVEICPSLSYPSLKVGANHLNTKLCLGPMLTTGYEFAETTDRALLGRLLSAAREFSHPIV
jgi:hypothetical protein